MPPAPPRPTYGAVPVRASRRPARPDFGRGLAYGLGVPLLTAVAGGVLGVAAPELAALSGVLWAVGFLVTLIASIWFMIARRHVSAIGSGMLIGWVIGLVGQIVASALLLGAQQTSP